MSLMTKTILAALFVAMALMIGTIAPAAFADPIWNATGDGVTVTDADQNDGTAAFEYSVNRGDVDFDERTWIFETIATETDTVTLEYAWSGFHAFVEVITNLQAFNGTSATTLVNDGPVDVGTYPSGGFNYNGNVTLNLVAGEAYGFILKGDNFDVDNQLIGAFNVTDITVADPEPEPKPKKNNPCDALEKAEKNGNGKHKGIPKAKANNGC